MTSLIVGLTGFGVSAACYGSASAANSKAEMLDRLQSCSIAQIKHKLDSMDLKQASTVGIYAEIKGRTSGLGETLLCDLSGQSALICEIIVERIIEELTPSSLEFPDPVQPNILGSNTRVSWIRRSEIVSSNVRAAKLFVEDGTGAIQIGLSDIDLSQLMVETVDRFHPPTAVDIATYGLPHLSGPYLSLGEFRTPLTALIPPSDRLRVLGYRFIERVLPVNLPILALGEIIIVPGEGLKLRKPDSSLRPFLLSSKNDNDLSKEIHNRSLGYDIAAVVAGIVGTLSLIWYAAGEVEKLKKVKK